MAQPEHQANPNKRQTTGVAYGLYANQHVVAIPFYDQDFRTQVDELSESEPFISRIVQSVIDSQADMKCFAPYGMTTYGPDEHSLARLMEIQLIVRNNNNTPDKAGKPLKQFTTQKQILGKIYTINITYLQGSAVLSEVHPTY